MQPQTLSCSTTARICNRYALLATMRRRNMKERSTAWRVLQLPGIEHCMATLTARRKNEAFTVIVDDDLPYNNRWYVDAHGYVYRKVYAGKRSNGSSKQRDEYLHRLVLGLIKGDGTICDHVNRNRLDNRRANLRVVTAAGNAQNRIGKRGRSLPRGVEQYGQRYRAYGTVNRKRKQIGIFHSVEDASAAACAWRKKRLPFSVD